MKLIALFSPIGSDSIVELIPIATGDAFDGNRTILPMQCVIEIQILFELAEVGKYIVPSPVLYTDLCPAFVVGGYPAQSNLGIDAGAAADETRLMKECGFLGFRRNLAARPEPRLSLARSRTYCPMPGCHIARIYRAAWRPVENRDRLRSARRDWKNARTSGTQ
jgi:hypothetical protein